MEVKKKMIHHKFSCNLTEDKVEKKKIFTVRGS